MTVCSNPTSASDIKSYKEDIEDARNQSEIDQIFTGCQLQRDRISNEERTKETGEKASASNESSLSTARAIINEMKKISLDELDTSNSRFRFFI
ncbi:hypothetical protein [Staphylococcus haemolyticus]